MEVVLNKTVTNKTAVLTTLVFDRALKIPLFKRELIFHSNSEKFLWHGR